MEITSQLTLGEQPELCNARPVTEMWYGYETRVYLMTFFYGAAIQRGPWPPHSLGF